MRRSRQSGRKSSTKPPMAGRKIKPILSAEPAARDEGPTVIPLKSEEVYLSGTEHYLKLADIALGRRRK